MGDKLAGWCLEWLAGSEGQALGRAAAQAAGLQAVAEGTRFARRVPGLLPVLLPSLDGLSEAKVCTWSAEKGCKNGRSSCLYRNVAQLWENDLMVYTVCVAWDDASFRS